MPLALPQLPAINPLERVFSRPSWIDSRFITLASTWTFTEYVATIGGNQQIANANSNRFGICFVQNRAVPIAVVVSPQNRPDMYGDLTTENLHDTIYTLFNFGQMVCTEWYAFFPAAGALGIYELVLEL